MRMFHVACVSLLLALSVHGLVQHHSSTRHFLSMADYLPYAQTSSSISMTSSASQDFVNRARKAAGMEPEAPPPKIFSDDLLADIQHCLLTLEKRVKEGPGSLSHAEIDEFALASARVLNDMKSRDVVTKDRIKPGERQARAEAAAAAAAVQAEQDGKTQEEIEAIAKAAFDAAFAIMIPPIAPAAKTSTGTALAVAPQIDSLGRISNAVEPTSSTSSLTPPVTTVTNPVRDKDNESEGPAYDGKGFGVARGTANTYVIEGMDEMTAEEYQEALSQQVIERARQRRYGLGGAHGNRQTLDYMNSLSGGRDINPMNAPKKD